MRRGILPLGLALALLLNACASKDSAPTGSGTPETSGSQAAVSQPAKITAEEAHARMESGDPIVVVDVRTAGEYAEKHIPGAILIPNEEIGAERPALLPVSDAEILLYCRTGNRSAQAAREMTDMGYSNVSDFGGINDWPYETQSGEYQVSEKEGTLTSFTACDLSGVPVDESVFADYRLTMINIWATFCGPCLSEMPELGNLASDYAERGVQVLGIVADVQPEADGSFPMDMVDAARELVAQTGAHYRHLLPTIDLISAKLNQVSAVPETIFVNDKGELVGKSYVGTRSEEEWAQIVDSLLETA